MELAFDLAKEVMEKIRSGEWEIHGLQIRETSKKSIRFVAKGFEYIQTNSDGLPVHPQLDILRSALNVQQILGMAAIAQNASLAVSLKHMEEKLDAITDRLISIEGQLKCIGTDLAMTRAASFQAPVAKLSAAKNAMIHAIRYNNTSSLITAAKDIEESGRLLLNHAEILVRKQMNNLPAFLYGKTTELSELLVGATHAFLIASDLHVRLKAPDIALRITRNISTRIEKLICEISAALSNGDFLPYRAAAHLDSDEEIAQLGQLITTALHETVGRSMLIELAHQSHETITDELLVEHKLITFVPVPPLLGVPAT